MLLCFYFHNFWWCMLAFLDLSQDSQSKHTPALNSLDTCSMNHMLDDELHTTAWITIQYTLGFQFAFVVRDWKTILRPYSIKYCITVPVSCYLVNLKQDACVKSLGTRLGFCVNGVALALAYAVAYGCWLMAFVFIPDTLKRSQQLHLICLRTYLLPLHDFYVSLICTNFYKLFLFKMRED